MEEAHDFLYTIAGVIDEEDQNKEIKNRKTKKEKKNEKREILKEKRKKRRPEEKQKKKKKIREELKRITSALNPEEQIQFLIQRKIIQRDEKNRKKQFLLECYNDGYKICLNCCFQSQMEDKEISSLAKQIFLTYHYMIKHRIPIQFHFSCLKEQDVLYNQLNKYEIGKWKVHIHDENYWETFPTENIVVLSPDAEEDLEEVKKDEVYIIGALVDRSVSKNLSYYQASLHGFTTKKLPLEKYIKKKKSNVLNVNTVIEILINFIKLKDWKQVFEKCLPQKKVMCFFNHKNEVDANNHVEDNMEKNDEEHSCVESSDNSDSSNNGDNSDSSDNSKASIGNNINDITNENIENQVNQEMNISEINSEDDKVQHVNGNIY